MDKTDEQMLEELVNQVEKSTGLRVTQIERIGNTLQITVLCEVETTEITKIMVLL